MHIPRSKTGIICVSPLNLCCNGICKHISCRIYMCTYSVALHRCSKYIFLFSSSTAVWYDNSVESRTALNKQKINVVRTWYHTSIIFGVTRNVRVLRATLFCATVYLWPLPTMSLLCPRKSSVSWCSGQHCRKR